MFRYNKIGYVALNVSNMEKSNKFYEDSVGLKAVELRTDGPRMFRRNISILPRNWGLKRSDF